MKFLILGVVIHPELHLKIIRPMEKDLAQLDLLFLYKSKKTVNFSGLKKIYNLLVLTYKQQVQLNKIRHHRS